MRQDLEALDVRFAEMSNSLANERERLSELIATAEIEIAALQAALVEAQGLLTRSNADLGGQVEALDRDIQALRGTLEQADFRINQLQEQFILLMEDIDMRMNSR